MGEVAGGDDAKAFAARPTGDVFEIDVRQSANREVYQLKYPQRDTIQADVLDIHPRLRHLVLDVTGWRLPISGRFLCGHDERHWFVASLPFGRRTMTVRGAMEALKPAAVLREQHRKGVRHRRYRRKTAAYMRQGEWFFLPATAFDVDEKLVLPNEPLTRGNGGKPHWAEFCYRTGGETVYVCSRHPNGVTEAQYKAVLAGSPKAKGWGWRTMRRNPGVYVRGRVRHADHARN
jgi:hypothetical protein